MPEWTKCSSREKRKEKKVEKPFYSDSEGESGPTESADSGNFRGLAGPGGIILNTMSSVRYVCVSILLNKINLGKMTHFP